MPKFCKLVEPISNRPSFPNSVGSNGTHMYECVRLITGTLDIELKDERKKKVKLNYCHLSQQSRRRNKSTISSINRLVFDDDLTNQDVENFLKKAKNDNRDFWEDVKSALCLALYASKAQNHLNAFLYLFRLFEFAASALPLVYASTTLDYRKALEILKNLNLADRDKDFAVLKKFAPELEKKGGLNRPLFSGGLGVRILNYGKHIKKQHRKTLF